MLLSVIMGGFPKVSERSMLAVCLFSNGSQMTSKCSRNKEVAEDAQPSLSLMFLPHCDVFGDLLI